MKYKIFILIAVIYFVFCGCSDNKTEQNIETKPLTSSSKQTNSETVSQSPKVLAAEQILAKYINTKPTQWGEAVSGVVRNFSSTKQIALTLDACGGKNGSGFDKELIDFLIEKNIPATLFVSYQWINKNEQTFVSLSKNPLFEIGNHGFEHRPLSVKKNSIYGIEATGSFQKTIDEILLNENKILQLTGKKPIVFRSGTAYYDEVSVQIANDLGYRVIGYSINGDAGATFNANQVEKSVSKAVGGDIIIAHFNRPEKQTFEGIKSALTKLLKDGYTFKKISD